MAGPAGASGNATLDALILKNPVPGWTDPQYGPTPGANASYQATEQFSEPSGAAKLKITIMNDPGYPFPKVSDLATLWCGQGAVILSSGNYQVIPNSIMVTCHAAGSATPTTVMVWQNGSYLPEVEVSPATALPLSQFENVAVRQAAAIPIGGGGSNTMLVAVGGVAAASLLVVFGVLLLRRRGALYSGAVGAPPNEGAERAGQPIGPDGTPGDDSDPSGGLPPPVPVREDWMPRRVPEEASTSPNAPTAVAAAGSTNGSHSVAPATSKSDSSDDDLGESLPPFQTNAPVKPAVVHVPDPDLAPISETTAEPLGDPLPAFRPGEESAPVPGLMPALASTANMPAVSLAREDILADVIPPATEMALPVPAMAAPAHAMPMMAAPAMDPQAMAPPPAAMAPMAPPVMAGAPMAAPMMTADPMGQPITGMPPMAMPVEVGPMASAPVYAPPMAAPVAPAPPMEMAAAMAAPQMAAPAPVLMAAVPMPAPPLSAPPMAAVPMPAPPVSAPPMAAVPMAVPVAPGPTAAVPMPAPPVSAPPMAAVPMPAPPVSAPPMAAPHPGLPEAMPSAGLPVLYAGGAADPRAATPVPVDVVATPVGGGPAMDAYAAPVAPPAANAMAATMPMVAMPTPMSPMAVPTALEPVATAPTPMTAVGEQPLGPIDPAPIPLAGGPEPIAAEAALPPFPIGAAPAPEAAVGGSLPVGWHPDPEDASGGAMYWDGTRWTTRRFWDGTAWTDAPI